MNITWLLYVYLSGVIAELAMFLWVALSLYRCPPVWPDDPLTWKDVAWGIGRATLSWFSFAVGVFIVAVVVYGDWKYGRIGNRKRRKQA